MASIDSYLHSFLDFIECPTDNDIVYLNDTRKIAIYKLDQDIPQDESAFDGTKGDLIIGGGSGEVKSFRISHKGISYFLDDNFDDFESIEELYKAFWTPTFCHNLGTGLVKLGWDKVEEMEEFLGRIVVCQLLDKKLI